MQLGADGVFVVSGIFKSGDPARRARAIVEATTHYLDADVLARVSAGLGEPMGGISTASLDPSELLGGRGGARSADGRHLDRVARSERSARTPRLVAAPGRPQRRLVTGGCGYLGGELV